MRTVPTKDKELKPVFRVMATVGTHFIFWFAPDKLGMRLVDMMRNAIISVCTSGKPAPRASLAFFLDCGYLDLTKRLTGTATSLIQIMQERGVKFLGTINNSDAFPFKFFEVNKN